MYDDGLVQMIKAGRVRKRFWSFAEMVDVVMFYGGGRKKWMVAREQVV